MEFHNYSSKCVFNSLQDIKNKKITIMGLGLNGGGLAAVRFFLSKGAYITVTDMKTAEQLKPTLDLIEKDNSIDKTKLTYVLGEHRLQDFEDADCVIKNPGVKYQDNKYLNAAKAIETDLSIFLRFTSCPIIAVTGSKGKSSTVSAIYYGLTQAGIKCFLGGNITVSPLTFIEQVTPETPVIIEFSSWQLSDLRGRQVLKPKISVITKIVPDHQNWYGNMQDYVADKRLIYENQDKNDFSIFDFDEDLPGTGPCSGGTWGDLFAKESNATVLRYSHKVLPQGVYGVWQDKLQDGSFCGKIRLPDYIKSVDSSVTLKDLSVPGAHMKTNVLNAALVMQLMGVDSKKCIEILSKWSGIDHRLQYFHSYKIKNTTYKFYNDSCSTVPDSAVAAIHAFEDSPILITGGTDKGLDFDSLIKTLTNAQENKVKDLYLLKGTATDKLLPHLEKSSTEFNGPYNSLKNLLTALKNNIDNNSNYKENQVIVFSPGATSFGMFANEFDRGNQFMNEVKEIFRK